MSEINLNTLAGDARLGRIFARYGTLHQVSKLSEESGELASQASRIACEMADEQCNGGPRFREDRDVLYADLASEAADVIVLLAQIGARPGFLDEVARQVERKISRQIDRIDMEQCRREVEEIVRGDDATLLMESAMGWR